MVDGEVGGGRGIWIVEQLASGASVQAWVDISLEKQQLGGAGWYHWRRVG